MVYQGLVIEVKKNYIIVLTDDTNYIKLKKKGNIDIGKKIMFIDEDIVKGSNKLSKPLIGLAAIIILAIITIIGNLGIDFMGNFQAYAVVSLDINPSLEFEIDKKYIVKRVNYMNKDGKELINDDMIGMKIEDVVIASIKAALDKDYLNGQNNAVLISDVVMDDNPQHSALIEDKIFKKISEDKELNEIEIIYIEADEEDLEKAKENKVSVGKYKAYKIISDNKANIKIHDVKVSDIAKEKNELIKRKKNIHEEEINKEKDSIKNNNGKSDQKHREKKSLNKNNEKVKKILKENDMKEKPNKNSKVNKSNKINNIKYNNKKDIKDKKDKIIINNNENHNRNKPQNYIEKDDEDNNHKKNNDKKSKPQNNKQDKEKNKNKKEDKGK
ncbi:anti-sigma factor domain-containing protein [Paramaledivibacter caminithermalis]|uniref:Anti-sigma factor N-terminus n=1 Tax=Paramaledivibacter caminithermalis (strain DSM 15212 / CIP 107654 / DViRD3) TaxID=1121301 RepID=A0A1M6LRG6_PARC5|nr:anti-sigma factor domain-containing protein [Paramaledivibacter caminithermalis]SHJ73773.1 Anti-sigma factor N-terminus [Paramaledivibacter caminithermalis DSM 15212]